MSNARDGSSPPSSKSDTQPDANTSAPGSPDEKKRSGRVSHDARGNSVWEWQLETGVYSRDISTQRLKKLDLNDLSIAETGSVPRPPGLGDPPGRKGLPGGGVNPYDNSTSRRGKVGSDPYNSAGGGALKPDAKSTSGRKPVDLKKLAEWMELRKRVERNKREDPDD